MDGWMDLQRAIPLAQGALERNKLYKFNILKTKFKKSKGPLHMKFKKAFFTGGDDHKLIYLFID